MDSFDVVIVGSGFGGSVSAFRVAEAGYSVAVLERGQSYPPNSFARSPYTLAHNFWDPSLGHFGLFNVWSFSHMDAVVSAGLGGGSLIYANVLIRKDEHWFDDYDAKGEQRPWPVTRQDLDPHYTVVEQKLGAQVFPMDAVPYNQVQKAAEFKRAALASGFQATTHENVDPAQRQWYLPLLAVTFANKGQPAVPGETIVEEVRNLHDRDRQTCRLCGECDLGCNFGAKNTLDYNYLTLAKVKGAEIRTLSEVRKFRPTADGDGFEVDYLDHGADDHESSGGVLRTIRARHLILSAGTLGSTFLLLKNAAALPPLSPMLGRRFSGNGDLLTMAVDAYQTSRQGGRSRVLDPSFGPVITSTLRSPDASDGAAAGSIGFYLQDAGYPVFLDWIVQLADVPNDLKSVAEFIVNRIRVHLLHRGGPSLDPALEKLLADTEVSAGSMPLLGMGRDVPDGVFSLDRRGMLALDWNKRGSQGFYDDVIGVSRQIAQALDASYFEDPMTSLFSRLITVHPLGGCPMGTSTDNGVVDSWGRVFGNPRLHIADGSVLPGPVGANPSLTIAALADRFADQLIEDLQSA